MTGLKDFCAVCGMLKEIVRTENLKYAGAGRFGFKEVKICGECDAARQSTGMARQTYESWYNDATKGTVRTLGEPQDLKLTSSSEPDVVKAMTALSSLDLSLARQLALSRLKGFLWGAVTVAGVVLLLLSNGTLKLGF